MVYWPAFGWCFVGFFTKHGYDRREALCKRVISYRTSAYRMHLVFGPEEVAGPPKYFWWRLILRDTCQKANLSCFFMMMMGKSWHQTPPRIRLNLVEGIPTLQKTESNEVLTICWFIATMGTLYDFATHSEVSRPSAAPFLFPAKAKFSVLHSALENLKITRSWVVAVSEPCLWGQFASWTTMVAAVYNTKTRVANFCIFRLKTHHIYALANRYPSLSITF